MNRINLVAKTVLHYIYIS